VSRQSQKKGCPSHVVAIKVSDHPVQHRGESIVQNVGELGCCHLSDIICNLHVSKVSSDLHHRRTRYRRSFTVRRIK
jgi:hypothetical protein